MRLCATFLSTSSRGFWKRRRESLAIRSRERRLRKWVATLNAGARRRSFWRGEIRRRLRGEHHLNAVPGGGLGIADRNPFLGRSVPAVELKLERPHPFEPICQVWKRRGDRVVATVGEIAEDSEERKVAVDWTIAEKKRFRCEREIERFEESLRFGLQRRPLLFP